MTNEFQTKVKKFMDENGMNNPIENRMLDLFDEVGEVAKEINKMSAYGTKPPEFRQEIVMELGDAFYSLITVANYYDVDLLGSLDMAMEKYEKRIERGGHAGSENDHA
ncbi:nucleotide pyrophosphohydrolase [Candidatus Falkowbacteria bacterium]|nr:nucleotide pyrophosphohydrolase [Candidatus Falkowbacteria bacterium]